MRFGIFGGTFDPIHLAHLRLAESAREQLRLSEVVFVPVGAPVHRQTPPQASREDRYAMCVAATARNPRFSVSRVEIENVEPSFTVHTLERLLRERSEARASLILGADEAAAFPGWREPRRILEMARLAVAQRPGVEASELEALPEWVRRRVDFVAMLQMDIYSTDIRARAARGDSIRYLVPDAVRRHIEKHGLYR